MDKNYSLEKFCLDGDLQKVRDLINEGVKASAMNHILEDLYSKNYFEIVQTLIINGADKYKVDSSPLISLIKMADVEGVKKSIAEGADLNQKNALGYTPLTWLGAYGRVSEGYVYSYEDRESLSKAVDSGMTFYEAWHEGYDRSFAKNRRSKDWLDAVSSAFLDITALLISNGADINMQDGAGETALTRAAGAVCDFLPVFIKAGADVNGKNKYGLTAVMIAAQHGDSAAVKFLLKAGADITCTGQNGHTALDLASQYSHKETIDILIAAGATPGSVTRTLVDIVKDNDLPALEAALAGGAFVNACNSYGYTALMVAAENKEIEIVEKLLKAGALVNVQTKSGWTALMAAGKNNDIPMIKLLLKAGADKTLQSKVYNRTAAIWAHDPEAKELLS